MPASPRPDTAPAVCRAGEFQFAPGQTHTNSAVQSRALFWCKSGHGRFAVNGRVFTLAPHDLYVLPWNRHISYEAGQREPMFTAHVHVVPWLRPGSRWLPNVPHEPSEPLYDSPDRADVPWPGLDDVVHLLVEADTALGRLINYTTRWFQKSDRREDEGRALGLLVVRQLLSWSQRKSDGSERRPEELSRLLVHVERCFAEGPTVERLATIIGRSRSHVLKLFQRHLGVSAKTFIITRQMREARELLLSTTLSVAEVGRLSGVPDPYHFSKLFRRTVGLSPRQYRESGGLFSTRGGPSAHRRVPPKPGRTGDEGG